MHGDAPRSPHTGVPGWETLDEQNALMQYAAGVPKGGLIVEIGGEFGMSASLFSKAADPSVVIVTVDLFPGNLIDMHMENLQDAGFRGRTIPIASDSALFGNEWATEGSRFLAPSKGKEYPEINLLFIDGDHSFEGCRRDIEAWVKYVPEGGIVLFHDATPPTNLMPHPLHHEVQRAINQWVSKQSQTDAVWTELPSVGTMRVFRLDHLAIKSTPRKVAKKS